MKFKHPLVLTVSLVAFAGVVHAFTALQDGTRFPGERQATTSVVTDAAAGDEVVLKYNTIQFGPQVTQMMLEAAPEQREGMAMRFIPGRLRGEFETDVDLSIGDQRLAAGTYGITFLANDEGGIHIRFLDEGQTALEAPTENRESTDEHRFLNFNFRSTGAESFILEMDYGTVMARLPIELAEEEIEEEE